MFVKNNCANHKGGGFLARSLFETRMSQLTVQMPRITGTAALNRGAWMVSEHKM